MQELSWYMIDILHYADGFKKLSTIEHGGLNAKDDMEFQNSYFTRENPNAMQHIKRKVAV